MEHGKYASRQEAHRYSAADKEREYKGHDVVVRRPEVDVNCVQDAEHSEPPRDPVDDDPLPSCGELVDNGSKKEQVNEGPIQRMKGGDKKKGWTDAPNQESPGSRCDIRFFARVVDVMRGCNGVNVGAEEGEIHQDVKDLDSVWITRLLEGMRQTLSKMSSVQEPSAMVRTS